MSSCCARSLRRRACRPSFLLAIGVLLAVCPLAGAAAAAPEARPAAGARRVVLDPGHGGSELGAQGPQGLLEKDVVLDISRRLAGLLRVDGFDVTLTRDGDDDRPLDTRAGVANNLHADLFVSIHANGSRFAVAHGAETYVLSREATDDAARTTAALENDAAGVRDTAPQGDGDLSLILWDLAQVQYLQESTRLAGFIQGRFNEALGLSDRGVRQAPFAVLRGATCPAVLVEVGFITNPDEEKLLASPDHRRRLAEILAEAIRRFRADTAPRAAQ